MDAKGIDKLSVRQDGVYFKIKVQPRSARNEIGGWHGDVLRIKLTAPPVDGEANRLCLEFLAGFLHVPKRNVELVSGQRSREKVVKVTGVNQQTLERLFRLLTP